jgi:hypothetical protein
MQSRTATSLVVDLHEDIANYYFAAGAIVAVEPFDEDVAGRHVDIPKYESAVMIDCVYLYVTLR